MSDPAVEAAQRLVQRYGDLAELPMDADDLAAAACEALTPIRDWSAKWSIELLRRDLGQAWSELAPLIFTSEEL